MCHYFEIFYNCGHSDIIEGPCDVRAECMDDLEVKTLICTKSHTTESDLERSCMTCSGQYPFGSNKNKQSKFAQNLLGKELSPIEVMIRNEAFLRKRSTGNDFVLNQKQTIIVPSPHELEVQFRVNEEFLSRRHKRRCFQSHLDHQNVSYQVFLEAAQLHKDAMTVLNNTASDNKQQAQRTAAYGLGSSARAIDAEERRAVHPALTSDDGRKSRQERRRPEPKKPSQPITLNKAQLLQEIEQENPQITGTEHEMEQGWWEALKPETEEDCRDLQAEAGGYEAECEGEDVPPPLFHGTRRGGIRKRPHSKRKFTPIALDSPEGMSLLQDFTKFFGMPPGASPAWVFDVLARDEALQELICKDLIPRNQLMKFNMEVPGLGLHSAPSRVLTRQDHRNRRFRESFILAWNSLDWSSRHQVHKSGIHGWLAGVARPPSKISAMPTLIEEALPGRSSFANVEPRPTTPRQSRPSRPPPRVPSPEMPLIAARPHAPSSEVSHFSDSSSSSSYDSSYSDDSDNFALEKTNAYLSKQETNIEDNYSESSDTMLRAPSLVSVDTAQGFGLLTDLHRILAFPMSRDAYDLSLFIDENKTLIDAIKSLVIPVSKQTAKKDPDYLRIRINPDQSFGWMMQEFFHALQTIYWDEIDCRPAPYRPKAAPLQKPVSLDWEDEARVQGLRKKVALPSKGDIELETINRFKKYRVRTSSHLRCSYTRCDEASDSDSDRDDDSDSGTENEVPTPVLPWTLPAAALTSDDLGINLEGAKPSSNLAEELAAALSRGGCSEGGRNDEEEAANEVVKKPISDMMTSDPHIIHRSCESRFDGPIDIPPDAPDTPPWPREQQWHNWL